MPVGPVTGTHIIHMLQEVRLCPGQRAATLQLEPALDPMLFIDNVTKVVVITLLPQVLPFPENTYIPAEWD
jgi:hypothetical protein